MAISRIEALTFDVFGTVVDWRGSIVWEGERFGREKGFSVEWGAFADAWRAGYHPSMEKVRTGELPWTNLDALHRMTLDQLVVQFEIAGLSEEDVDRINRVWHRLQPWPDAIPGLIRMREKFLVAPLSNGNMALLTNMAKHAGIPWDCILSAELAHAYKPDPAAYRTAAELLGLPVDRVMMVAAHQHDLRGARAAGMKTAFVPRPFEFGPDHTPDPTPDPDFDVVASDFVDLARQLGA